MAGGHTTIHLPFRCAPSAPSIQSIHSIHLAINCLGLTSTPKDALFTELHTLCIQHALRHSTNGFTVNAIPIRFGQLTSLLIELTVGWLARKE